ncbi:helix-turn-helix domain-containing protein [Vibrio lentus]
MHVIALVRKDLGYSQLDLAKKMNVSVDTVKSWETGRRNISDSYVEALMLWNENPILTTELKRLRPINDMIQQVRDYLDLEGSNTRFVFRGGSGCGKTKVVNEINSSLRDGEDIAASRELYDKKIFCTALDIVKNHDGYEGSKYIAFYVLSDELADSLELNGIKVFRFS